MKTRLFHMALISIAFAITCVFIATGAYFHAGLDVRVGMPASEMVRAPHEVQNTIATELNRQQARSLAEGLPPAVSPDPEEWRIVENNLRILRNQIDDIRIAYSQERQAFEEAIINWEITIATMDAEAEAALAEWNAVHNQIIADGGTAADVPPQPIIPMHPSEPEWQGESFSRFLGLPVSFTDPQEYMLVHMTEQDYSMFWSAIDTVASIVQTEIINAIDLLTARRVEDEFNNLEGLDHLTVALADHIVLSNLRTNSIIDVEQTRINFENQAAYYQEVWFVENQIIIDIGQIVTEDIYEILFRLGLLRPDSIRDNLVPMLGVFIVVAALFLASLMYLFFYHTSIFINKKESMLLFTLYVLNISLVWMLSEFSFPFVPLLIFPMLAAVLIDRRSATVLTFSIVLTCYFIVPGSLTYLLFYTTSGILICLISRFTTERNKVFLVGLLMMVIQFALSVAITLIVERNQALYNVYAIQELITTAGIAAISGMLVVIICTGSLPFWETFFGVVTPVKLLDLTNPTNLLLRRLTIEAPGTYHHSLIVANLAETAAYDIGGNTHAARVGGYYHDVGKLKFPHYFAENLDKDNPHDHLDPISSAQLIISHVSYGLTLASEHRLPQFVRDMIKEHHGTTLLQFFYAKAKESDPQADDKDYRYPFTIPQTRESACVMLADSVEAAVRAMMPKMKSVDEVEQTIRNIIRGKLNDGQLADSQLSIKDVIVIEQSFFRVLKGMYHERIAYPKASPPEEKAADIALSLR